MIHDGRCKEELDCLVALMQSVSLSNREDRWYCIDGPKEEFLVSWWTKAFIKNAQVVMGKNKWCKWIPKKYNILVWKLSQNMMAVKMILGKLEIRLHSTICTLCKTSQELDFHAFMGVQLQRRFWTELGSGGRWIIETCNLWRTFFLVRWSCD